MAAFDVRAAALTFLAAASLAAAACGGGPAAQSAPSASGPTSSPPLSTPFASDLQFLNAHTHIVLLKDADGAQVAVAPVYQGRVMTSTTGGSDAPSFGWIGRAAVESGRHQSHMNVFGGEDRFWLGPEGGQFALFFGRASHSTWITGRCRRHSTGTRWTSRPSRQPRCGFHKHVSLVNYARTPLRHRRRADGPDGQRRAGRRITRLSRGPASGWSRSNRRTSSRTAGRRPGSRQSGLVSVWILGQFNPSPTTTIVIPFKGGEVASLGPIVNDAYFGKVPATACR